MQDRPTSGELAGAIREFLKEEILPGLVDPRAKFRALVAMNALGILEREFAYEETLLEAEHERLARLLDKDPAAPTSPGELRERVVALNQELAESIRSEEVPEGALDTIKETAADKLRVASPRYLERYGGGL